MASNCWKWEQHWVQLSAFGLRGDGQKTQSPTAEFAEKNVTEAQHLYNGIRTTGIPPGDACDVTQMIRKPQLELGDVSVEAQSCCLQRCSYAHLSSQNKTAGHSSVSTAPAPHPNTVTAATRLKQMWNSQACGLKVSPMGWLQNVSLYPQVQSFLPLNECKWSE